MLLTLKESYSPKQHTIEQGSFNKKFSTTAMELSLDKMVKDKLE